MTEPTISQWLELLKAAELIRAVESTPELEYLFRHVLVQDAAYASLLKADRRELHRSVGETLERLYADRLDEFASTLAYHFSHATMHEKAFRYLMQAARRAQTIYANAEALAHYRAAIAEARLLDQSTEWAQETAPAYEGQGDMLFILGQRDEARESFETALSHTSSADPVWQARLQRKIGGMHIDRDDKMRQYQIAQTLLGDPGESNSVLWWEEWIELQMRFVMRHYFANEVAEMEAVMRHIEPLVAQHGSLPQRAEFATIATYILYRRDRFVISDETLRYAHRALELAEAIRNPAKIADAQTDVGFCYLFYPDLDKAVSYLGAALDFATRTGHISMQAQTLTHLTTAYRIMGDLDHVRECAQRALTLAAQAQIFFYEAAARANLSWLAWQDNNPITAKQEAQAALDQWVEKDKTVGYPWQWLARLQLMAMALDEGAHDQAVQQAVAMLGVGQQRLPDALNNALEHGITEPTALDAAVNAARTLGYL